MSVTDKQAMVEDGAFTVVEERKETTASGCETGSQGPNQPQLPVLELKPAAGTSSSGEERAANSAEQPANHEAGDDTNASHGVKLCSHIKEDGVFCGRPACRERPYCYQHLRLRGQQMRMARAIAQRQSYHLVLPALDDMHAVQAGLAHVTAALAAGLLERRRAGLLLYALQQTASALRWMARAQAIPAVGAPPLSPSVGDSVGGAVEPQRRVEEYPCFETEFGLPPGLDLTLPPQVAFPPPVGGWATDNAENLIDTGPPPKKPWTKECIELEELDNRRSRMSEKSYNEQSRKVHDKIHHQVVREMRQKREAEWEAEAARRNAREGEKAQRWLSMDKAQQRAFMEGVMTGRQEEAEERQQREAQAKKPAAKVGAEEAIVGMGQLPQNEAAK